MVDIASVYFTNEEVMVLGMYIPAELMIEQDELEYKFTEDLLSKFLYYLPSNVYTDVIRNRLQEAGKNIYKW